jgi:methionine-rich copper-binding protein CopC
MAKARFILLGILAALATSAAATATASAHEFLVEGTPVSGSVAGTFTSATSHLRGELSGTKIDVTAGSDSGTFTLSAGGADAAAVSFTSLALYETNSSGQDTVLLSKCTVNEGKVLTFSVNTKLEELSSKLVDNFVGTAPPLFVNIPVTGSSCALKKAVNEATGNVDALLPEGEVNKVLHNLEFVPGSGQSLEFAGKPASFESKESLVLSSPNGGKSWSAKK